MPEIEKYSIKLDRDGGIHPGDIPAGKLAELLAVLSKMFADKTDDFCLSAMEDNCVRLDFNYSSPLVKATIIAFSAFLSGQTIASDSPLLQHLSDFDKVRSKFADVSIVFPSVEGYPAITLTADKKLAAMIKEKPNIHFQHTIYGKVIDAGGDRPNIHIRPLGGGDVIICDCSEELAAKVAHQLYSIVGIVGEVTRSNGIIRMKANALLPYRKPDRNPFAILKESGVGKYFEGESVEDFMRKVRGTDGENDD